MDSTLAHSASNTDPQQEQLHFAALNSNKPARANQKMTSSAQRTSDAAMAPASLTESPQQMPGSGSLGFEESPFVDYDYEFDGDGSFDFDNSHDAEGQMIGHLPGSSSDGDGDGPDKRGLPEDDRDEDEGGGKRRESEEKSSKKPGRKPLTSEPTTKRKAQNRAAQRAFRERKEKHLKDLETKVEDLEKASESANHENAILRAQIEKMSMEIREYRKRLSLNNSNKTAAANGGVPAYLSGKNLGLLNNPNDVSFSFDFPKFGRLPGPAVTNGSATSPSPAALNGSRSSASPGSAAQSSVIDRESIGPHNQPLQSFTANASDTLLGSTELSQGDLSSLSGLFSPTLLNSVGKDPTFDYFLASNGGANRAHGTHGSMSSAGQTSYSSPSSSSNGGNPGPSSSCGTSPEPTMQSPVNKTMDVTTLSTIGEERTEGTSSDTTAVTAPSSFDFNGIDWLAQQNNNQFDPQLFGDYREPQDNIVSGGDFTDNFFSDAYAMPDFSSPYNTAPSPAAAVAVPPAAPASTAVKKSIVAQIDERQGASADEKVVPGEHPAHLLTCNTIWDRLQSCPQVRDGEFDLDLLCKDLQKKAKCSETGAVVNEADFNKVLFSHGAVPAAGAAAGVNGSRK